MSPRSRLSQRSSKSIFKLIRFFTTTNTAIGECFYLCCSITNNFIIDRHFTKFIFNHRNFIAMLPSLSIWRKSVVFPDPKKPVNIVTAIGSIICLLYRLLATAETTFTITATITGFPDVHGKNSL